MPSASPIHHVATTPQAIASSVGSSVGTLKIGGCPIVKYSMHTRAVIWSCKMPYVMADNTERTTMARDCRSVVKSDCADAEVAMRGSWFSRQVALARCHVGRIRRRFVVWSPLYRGTTPGR